MTVAAVGANDTERLPLRAAARVLLALCVEKVVQHAVVTWALLTDFAGIRDTVEVDHGWLIGIGATVGVAFAIAGAGLYRRRRWSLALIAALALVDIVGEFVAQGTVSITVTVSFLVAIAALVLALRLRRTGIVRPAGTALSLV